MGAILRWPLCPEAVPTIDLTQDRWIVVRIGGLDLEKAATLREKRELVEEYPDVLQVLLVDTGRSEGFLGALLQSTAGDVARNLEHHAPTKRQVAVDPEAAHAFVTWMERHGDGKSGLFHKLARDLRGAL